MRYLCAVACAAMMTVAGVATTPSAEAAATYVRFDGAGAFVDGPGGIPIYTENGYTFTVFADGAYVTPSIINGRLILESESVLELRLLGLATEFSYFVDGQGAYQYGKNMLDRSFTLDSLPGLQGVGFPPGEFQPSDVALFATAQGQQLTLDNFAFVNFGVPEPATWAMMIAGFGLVGGSMRRRRALLRAAVA